MLSGLMRRAIQAMKLLSLSLKKTTFAYIWFIIIRDSSSFSFRGSSSMNDMTSFCFLEWSYLMDLTNLLKVSMSTLYSSHIWFKVAIFSLM